MAGSRHSSSVAPVFIRFALGLTFLWAGFGKILEHMPVTGSDAAILTSMGVLEPLKSDPSSPPPKDSQGPPAPDSLSTSPEHAQQPGGEQKVLAVHGITLLLYHQSHPTPDASGNTPTPLVPAWAGQDRWPLYLAWTATVSELMGGLFVLVGLLTRLSSFMLAGTIGTAMWLTQLGPAIQAHNTLLGFIPNHPPYATDVAGTPVFAILFWHLLLLFSSLSLMFSGAGALSFDRALFPNNASPSRRPQAATSPDSV